MCEAADVRLTLTAQAASTPGTDDFYGFLLWQWTFYIILRWRQMFIILSGQTRLPPDPGQGLKHMIKS